MFDNSKIIDIQRWGKEGPGKEGIIMHATFELFGIKLMYSDSPPVHNWDFTPAISNYVKCTSEEEVERLFSNFSENGQVAMPLDDYGFSRKLGWVIVRFGVSWQLNLRLVIINLPTQRSLSNEKNYIHILSFFGWGDTVTGQPG